MTFEEKLAEHGRWMDEMKAKLDETLQARKQNRQENREELAAEIAKLDAAFDEFDAAMDKQFDKRLDAADERIDRTAEKLSASLDRTEEKLENRAAKTKAAFTLDRAAVEQLANEPTGLDRIDKGAAEQVARAKGDVAVAAEHSRMAHEYRDSKRNSVQLRTQMRVNNAKDKISARREAKDKESQEQWILDLLDYADSCYEMAYSWAMEAEYTLMEAAYEIDYYNERFLKEK